MCNLILFLQSGTYYVDVEKGQCQGSDTIVIDLQDCSGLEESGLGDLQMVFGFEDQILRVFSVSDYNLEFYNETGQLVRKNYGLQGSFLCDLNGFSAGVYLVRVRTNENTQGVIRKIVIH